MDYYGDIDDPGVLTDMSLRGQMQRDFEDYEEAGSASHRRHARGEERYARHVEEDDEEEAFDQMAMMSGGLAPEDAEEQNRRGYETLQAAGYYRETAEAAPSSKLFLDDNPEADPEYFSRTTFPPSHDVLKMDVPIELYGYLADLDDKLNAGEDLTEGEWDHLQRYRKYGDKTFQRAKVVGSYRADDDAALDNLIAGQGRHVEEVESRDWDDPGNALAWPRVHPHQDPPYETTNVERERDDEELPYEEGEPDDEGELYQEEDEDAR